MLKSPRWHEVLLEIYKIRDDYRYCERLHRNIDGSMTHLRKIVKMLHDKDLIKIVPETKIKKIELTEKGYRIASALITVKTEIN